MPACVIWGLNIHTAKDIQDVFDVSYTSAKYVLNECKYCTKEIDFDEPVGKTGI